MARDETGRRRELTALAWQALALARGGVPLEVRVQDQDLEALVRVTPAGWSPENSREPPAVARLFLTGTTPLEQTLLAVLREAGQRRTLVQLRDAAEARLRQPISEGALKLT